MQYPDKEFTFDMEVVEEYFNGTDRTEYSSETRFQGYSSVSQYFWDASFGKLDLKFDIYGPYTADNDHDYYGKKRSRFMDTVSNIDAVTERKAQKDDGIYALDGRYLGTNPSVLPPGLYIQRLIGLSRLILFIGSCPPEPCL